MTLLLEFPTLSNPAAEEEGPPLFLARTFGRHWVMMRPFNPHNGRNGFFR